MILLNGALLLASLQTVVALALAPLPRIKNVVTFGDSFTDTKITGDGAVAWPDYLAGHANLSLYPFARAGGSCSNEVTYRPWPSVMETQVPTFLGQLRNGTIEIKQSETLYTLWIGTNDVGAGALLSGDAAPGMSVVDTTTCAVNWVKYMYKNAGARNFLFQNMVPLEKIPMYTPDAYYTKYWTYPRNNTAWSVQMMYTVKSGNALARLLLQDLAPQLPGAHIGLFDSHALYTDMYNNPSKYLNGTGPPNVTGSISACVFQAGGTSETAHCTDVPKGSAWDSYLWYDELHPSEQANRIVAREVAAVLKGSTKWTKWFS